MSEFDPRTMEIRAGIKEQAERVEEQTAISAVAQRRAAEAWGWIYYVVGVPATVLAALAGASALADYKVLAAVLALSSAVVSAVLTFLNPAGQASEHRKASSRFRSIQNRARLFASVACEDGKITELRAQLAELTEDWGAADEQSPHVVERIYRAARRAVEGDRRASGEIPQLEAAPRP
jgi:hypothetical protein